MCLEVLAIKMAIKNRHENWKLTKMLDFIQLILRYITMTISYDRTNLRMPIVKYFIFIKVFVISQI